MQQPPRSAPRTGARGHPPRRGAGVSTALVDIPGTLKGTITQMALHPLHRSSLLLGLLLASATEGRDFEDEEEDTGLPPTPPSSMEDGLPPPPKKELRLPRPKRHRREQKVERRTTAKRKAKRGW